MRIIFLLLIVFIAQHSIAANTNTSLHHIEQNLSDSMITTKITAKFTKNELLNPLKISINTKDGIVTLTGYVGNKNAFVEALRLVKSTHGVKTIRVKELYIKQVNTAFTDTYITAKVETAILKAKVLDDESIPLVGINAKTLNGVVTLSGEVKRAESVAAIIKRVKVVRGVKQIVSRLSVKQTIADSRNIPLATNPTYFSWKTHGH